MIWVESIKRNQNIIRRLHFIVYIGIISHVILGAVKIKARTLGYIGVVLVCFCYAIIHTRSFCIIKPIKDTNFMIMHFITTIADYRTNEETFYYYCAYVFVGILFVNLVPYQHLWVLNSSWVNRVLRIWGEFPSEIGLIIGENICVYSYSLSNMQ